jgi:endonuclease YncB( thermonuclease family)
MGILKMRGTIDVSQFWPEGSSDADTTNLEIQIDQNAFEYQAHLGAVFVPTKVLYTANVAGAGPKPKPAVRQTNAGAVVTVRLQGIDAPELHYQMDPRKLPKGTTSAQREQLKAIKAYQKFRQHLGEAATVALKTKLSKLGNQLTCEIITEVDSPGQVFDTYGRFVGDVHILTGTKLNINQWLVKEGWAYPTFYSSMSNQEIQTLIALAEKAQQKQPKGLVWKHYSKQLEEIDDTLTYRHPTKAVKLEIQPDTGPTVMPKLFRRLVGYTMCKRVGIIDQSFPAFLQGNKDECFSLEDFIEQGKDAAQIRFLHEFFDANGRFKLLPQQLVFREKPSRLLKANGDPITKW